MKEPEIENHLTYKEIKSSVENLLPGGRVTPFRVTPFRVTPFQLMGTHHAFSLLQLTFSDFSVENHPTCTSDSVTVRNGDSPGSPIIGRYCGQSVPGPIQSGSNQLVVTFNTNNQGQSRGFYATWNTNTLGKKKKYIFSILNLLFFSVRHFFS